MGVRGSRVLTVGLAVLALSAVAAVPPASAQVRTRFLYATYGFSPAQRFSRPSGMFYHSPREELYVADTGNGQIVILDRKGTPVAKIPHLVKKPNSDDRIKGEPRSVAVRPNGDILVVDNLCSYVDVLDFRGRSVQKVWPADLVGKDRSSVQPRCLAIDSAGNVVVGVTGHTKEILVLAPNLSLKTQMGVEATGESKSITGLWADSNGRIYATYAAGKCVQVFSPDGAGLLSFGTHDAGPNNFSLPAGLVTDAKGRSWVVDTLRHVVSVFNIAARESGLGSSFIALEIGGRGRAAGNLEFPSAMAGDGANRLFVAESVGARIQAFEILPDSGSPG